MLIFNRTMAELNFMESRSQQVIREEFPTKWESTWTYQEAMLLIWTSQAMAEIWMFRETYKFKEVLIWMSNIKSRLLKLVTNSKFRLLKLNTTINSRLHKWTSNIMFKLLKWMSHTMFKLLITNYQFCQKNTMLRYQKWIWMSNIMLNLVNCMSNIKLLKMHTRSRHHKSREPL